ncbi:hypothetical protein K1719_020480 [Acacia pycnantha]|nr:hypothetical protein K1719_020480 [Acacia pycnantha]
MASSDDEAEVHPQSVSNYHFEDDEKVPISFSVLPIQWSESEEGTDGESGQVFLDGSADNGLQKVFMQVVAWKFDISGVKPEISVLSKTGRQWVKLEKPKKWLADTIRTILISIHFLHHVQKNPETSAKSVWGYLYKDLSYFEVRPSRKDLLNHLPLIHEAVKRNAILAKSKLLLKLLERPGKVKVLDEEANNLAKPEFIVDDDVTGEDDDVSDEADDVIDEAADDSEKVDFSVCVLCDNGGTMSFCDGICMRSFHATKEAGSVDGANCDSLGFTQEEIDEIKSFICRNCEHNQHQCFVCGKLGNSNKSSCAEVFKCDVATCGNFYHLRCVAKELGTNIADGESFICPIHTCCICKEREYKEKHELQFAVCRRCPTAYHHKCLPREIAFEDDEEGFPQRAWTDLLPNKRILIYCLKHELDEELGTPVRDHVRFPKIKRAVQEIGSSFEEETKASTRDRCLLNKNNVDQDDSTCKRTNIEVLKLTEKSSFKKASSKKEFEHIISGPNVLRRRKSNDAVGRNLNEKKKSIPEKRKILDGKESQILLGQRPCDASMTKSSKKIEFGVHEANGANKSLSLKHTNKKLNNVTKRRLLDLFEEATSSISLDDVSEKLKFASTQPSSLRTYVDKTITAGKLEASVDAVRTALRRLEEGNSIEDATSVCDLDILNQIFKWRDKLRVYLAPVLNGNRYTSYGRHFTTVEKLEGIVDRLHWYVKTGDTIVDFCCGANDFSILMKRKLEEIGKKCFYKNYDLLPTKVGYLRLRRLDNKRTPYDLVWEDENFLSGKSFYLPGSIDINNRQMGQANVRAPVLYLWSRQDWTDTHKPIAQEHGHVPSQRDDPVIEKRFDEISPADHIMDVDHGDNMMLGHDLPKVDNDREGGRASRSRGGEENLSHGNLAYGNHVVQEHSISKSDKSITNSDKTSWKKRTEVNASRGYDVVSPTNKQAVNDTYDEVMQQRQKRVCNDRLAEELYNLSTPVSSHKVNDHVNENYESTSRSHKARERASHGTRNRNRSSYARSRSDYRARNFKEHRNSPQAGSPRSLEYRSHFRDEQRLRETDIRQQNLVYGIQDQDYIRSRFQSGGDSAFGPIGTNHGQLGLDPRPSYLNTSTMQRYAPRLDESNHVRTRTFGSEPLIIGRNLDHSVPPQPAYRDPPLQPGYLPPQPGYLPPQPRYGGPPPQPGYGGSSMDFMHPHNAYSHYN